MNVRDIVKKMKFHYWPGLPYPPEYVPSGYVHIEAFYSEEHHEIILSCYPDYEDENHNCDAEGCGTMSHVMRIALGSDNKPILTSDNEDYRKEETE